jgi:hypothetical protein
VFGVKDFFEHVFYEQMFAFLDEHLYGFPHV